MHMYAPWGTQAPQPTGGCGLWALASGTMTAGVTTRIGTYYL